MAKPILYYFDLSPLSRATRLTVNAVGLDVEYRHVNTVLREQFQPEFLAINPQHTVPVLIDNGLTLTDSHAINTYLVTKYGKNDSLYPSDPSVRAQIDQRLHFDTGILFPRFVKLISSCSAPEITELPNEPIDSAVEAIQFLETFLSPNNDYLVGNCLTLADFSCGTAALSLISCLSVDNKQFPRVFAWIERLNQLPFNQEVNVKPALKIAELVKGQLEENRKALQGNN